MGKTDLISRAAVIDAIVSMTSLPDVDSIKSIYNIGNGEEWVDGVYDAINAVEDVNAVDAVPVVHGRWSEKRWMTDYDWGVINHRAIVCSTCKGEIADGEQTRYCPNCGAKMDGERRDGDA